MQIVLTKDTVIEEIPQTEFNPYTINRIDEEYGGLRQDSKAPT